jgi:hypothetical protein
MPKTIVTRTAVQKESTRTPGIIYAAIKTENELTIIEIRVAIVPFFEPYHIY